MVAKPARKDPKSGPTAANDASESIAESWTFLSNHTHVLVALAKDPHKSLREVALAVGITERSVQRIVSDLEGAGYLEKQRVGRNNQYQINTTLPLRHSLENHCTMGDILKLIV